jgi:pimeloyl-ACP methyl ester carboxylesterase
VTQSTDPSAIEPLLGQPGDIRAGFARTDDGLELYYRVIGRSGPWIVCCNGVGVSTFFFRYITEAFRGDHRVVVWDYRGHGRSAPPPEPVHEADLSIERNTLDLLTVMDAVGVDTPAILMGHSMGCQVILQAALMAPDRVAGLVPMFGTYGRPLDTFMDSPMARPAFNLLYKVARIGGKPATRMLLPLYDNPLAAAFSGWTGMIDRHYVDHVDMDRYLDHLVQMDPRIFLRMVSLMADHDAGPHLPEIEAPTLIIAAEKDLFTPLHRSHAMHRAMPHAELLVLAEGSHAAIVEHPETIERRIRRWFREQLSEVHSTAPYSQVQEG